MGRAAVCGAAGLVAFAVVGGTCVSLFGIMRPTPAHIVVDRTSHNWGHVRPGTHVSTTFVIRNNGGKTLTFGKLQASCGCTKSELSDIVLPPGGQTKLEVGFDVPQELGTVHHFVKVPTNDPTRAETTLSLFAEVWRSVQASPQAVDFGQLRPGQEAERLVQLYSPDARGFVLSRQISDLPEVTLQAENPRTPIRVHRATIRFSATERLGQYQGHVAMVTDREDAPVIDIPVAAQVVGELSVSPAKITIEKGEIGTLVTRTIIVRANTAGVLPRLRKIEPDAPWQLERSESTEMRGGLLAIKFAIRFPKNTGAPSGALRLSLEAPQLLTYRVPLIIEGWTPPFPGGDEK